VAGGVCAGFGNGGSGVAEAAGCFGSGGCAAGFVSSPGFDALSGNVRSWGAGVAEGVSTGGSGFAICSESGDGKTVVPSDDIS
jgi:hypothetical protein